MTWPFPEECSHFPDPIDNAQVVADRFTQESLTAARAKCLPEQVRGEDGEWPITECVVCGVDLNPARLLMARIRCLACQTDKEKREKKVGFR